MRIFGGPNFGIGKRRPAGSDETGTFRISQTSSSSSHSLKAAKLLERKDSPGASHINSNGYRVLNRVLRQVTLLLQGLVTCSCSLLELKVVSM